MKTWLTVAEGAEYSGVSRDTIYTACERGELRHARVGGRRAIRLKPEWIDAWLEQHARGTIVARVNAPEGSGGGWEVDVTVRLPNGARWRERSKAPVSSKSAAVRWGEDRERHVLQHGLPQPKREVPTLEQTRDSFGTVT